MRIQTALRERNTRLLQVFASVRNFTFLSRVFTVDAKDVLPSADTTTGRSLQKHSQDPGFQNIARAAGPLPSIRTRPVSPGRRVQSFNLPPSSLSVKGWAAMTFCLSSARNFLQRLQSTGLPAFGQGRFFRIPSPRPTRRRFRRQPYNISASPTPVNPCPKHPVAGATGLGEGAPSIVRAPHEVKRLVGRPPTSVAAAQFSPGAGVTAIVTAGDQSVGIERRT